MAIRVHRLTGQGTIYMKIGCKDILLRIRIRIRIPDI